MPFRTFVREGVLTSDDLDFLQGVYDSATEGMVVLDDAAIHRVVHELIRHYRTGIRDRYWLVMLAESLLQRAAG